MWNTDHFRINVNFGQRELAEQQLYCDKKVGRDSAMCLSEVIASLSCEAAELLADHREQTAKGEVGVHGGVWRALATYQLRDKLLPHLLNLNKRITIHVYH